MNRHLSSPPTSKTANLIFAMMSIRCHVEGRLSPGCQFYHPSSMIQYSQKKYPKIKQLLSWSFSAKTNYVFGNHSDI